MNTVIISLGGSIINPEDIDISFLKSFKRAITDYVNKGNRVVIVTGGGSICRKYQNAAKAIKNLTDDELDEIGIAATKLHADFIRLMFGEIAFEKIIDNPTAEIDTEKKILVGSGWKPGFSSDRDAVLLANNLKADTVINLTNIQYVYDKDPKEYPEAKPFKQLSWKEFGDIIGKDWTPGLNVPFDPVASSDAEKNNIRVVILKGLENLESFLNDRQFEGTIIS